MKSIICDFVSTVEFRSHRSKGDDHEDEMDMDMQGTSFVCARAHCGKIGTKTMATWDGITKSNQQITAF